VLIHWEDMAEAEATWEPVEEFRALFPAFQLEDALFIEGERCYGGERLPAPEAEPWLRNGPRYSTPEHDHQRPGVSSACVFSL
jgi:hypothetical protein